MIPMDPDGTLFTSQNLTGGLHKTDVSNASRTMLMNIHTLKWDEELLQFFGIPKTMLPEICSSSETYGLIKDGNMAGVPACGVRQFCLHFSFNNLKSH